MENMLFDFYLPLRHLSCTNPPNINKLLCTLFIIDGGYSKLIYLFRLKDPNLNQKKIDDQCNGNTQDELECFDIKNNLDDQLYFI